MKTESTPSLVQRLDALYEYDREPVTERNIHGWKVFWATFAGEHIAGTEFVLGPLFVLHGATAVDVFGGLAIGDGLAVLSWALICAPIAVKTRLTVYWQMRQVGGPLLTFLYSSLFAVFMCLLAGSMVNVSVTAVALPFHIANPGPGDLVPSVPWVAIAIGVGALISFLAVLGFEWMAIFSKMCAPWMVTIFFIAAIATLPSLGCHSLHDFWRIANERIWTGVAAPGYTTYRFWHIVGFAWLCNVTQHVGMGDLTILRFARKWQMGFTSSAGMYLGHFCAWIASGILCAAAIGDKSPGPIAYLGAGWAGAFCVVVAGWNVASPTLYRAGLALQVVTPGWKRWKITFIIGVMVVICACIPALLRNLDRIVGYNGLFFLPLGAFIFIDYWLFPKLGLQRSHAERTGALFSWPAGVAWFGALLFSLFVYGKDHYDWVHALAAGRLPAWLDDYRPDLFYLVLPEWLTALALYIIASAIVQRSSRNLAASAQ